jgi:hypothetical protein
MSLTFRAKSQELRARSLPFLLCLLCFASARADLEVNGRVDKVVLTDGTEIECVVVMVAENGALIVEGDPKDKSARRQRLIPKDQIAKIIHGEANGKIDGFQTDTELCRKVVQGTGFRKEEAKSKVDKDNIKAPTTAISPEELARLKLNKELAGPVPESKLSTQALRDAYVSRFPALKDTTQSLLGNDRAMQVLDQAVKGDPLVRRQVESFLSLVLAQNAAPAVAESVAPLKSLKPIKPKKNRKDDGDGSTPPNSQPQPVPPPHN